MIEGLPYEEVIEHYGTDNQVLKAVEELMEMMEELLKYLEGAKNKKVILEEMADVLNMMAQLQLIFGFQNLEVFEKMSEKMERTLVRMQAEKAPFN